MLPDKPRSCVALSISHTNVAHINASLDRMSWRLTLISHTILIGIAHGASIPRATAVVEPAIPSHVHVEWHEPCATGLVEKAAPKAIHVKAVPEVVVETADSVRGRGIHPCVGSKNQLSVKLGKLAGIDSMLRVERLKLRNWGPWYWWYEMLGVHVHGLISPRWNTRA